MLIQQILFWEYKEHITRTGYNFLRTYFNPSSFKYCPISLTISWFVWLRLIPLLVSPCSFSSAPLLHDGAPFCTHPLLADCIALSIWVVLRVFLRGGSPPSSPDESLSRLIFEISSIPLLSRFISVWWTINQNPLFSMLICYVISQIYPSYPWVNYNLIKKLYSMHSLNKIWFYF